MPTEPLKQNPKDKLWAVAMQVCASSAPSVVLGLDGRPSHLTATFHDLSETTAHGPDEATVRLYVEQQNPGCRILSVKEVTP